MKFAYIGNNFTPPRSFEGGEVVTDEEQRRLEELRSLGMVATTQEDFLLKLAMYGTAALEIELEVGS